MHIIYLNAEKSLKTEKSSPLPTFLTILKSMWDVFDLKHGSISCSFVSVLIYLNCFSVHTSKQIFTLIFHYFSK